MQSHSTPKTNLEIGVEGGAALAKMRRLSTAKCCLIYSVNSTADTLKGDVPWLVVSFSSYALQSAQGGEQLARAIFGSAAGGPIRGGFVRRGPSLQDSYVTTYVTTM